MDVKIKRALLSVSDKAGILDFARNLSELGVELPPPAVRRVSFAKRVFPLKMFPNSRVFRKC